MPHLQLSAAALSAPPAAASTRRRFSTRLRSPDTVRVLRFLDQAEARRATSTMVRLGGAVRRSIHAELADREETAERPERMGTQMRGHERGLAKLCTIVLFFGCNHRFSCRMRVRFVEIRSFDFQTINHWLRYCSKCCYDRSTV